MHADQSPEGGRLGVAELGELGGGVLHRAVVLAELDAKPLLVDGCGVAIGRQRRGEGRGSVLGVHVQRLATIAHGDGVCTTFIPTGKATQ